MEKETKPKKQLGKIILKVVLIFLCFELVVNIVGAILANSFWKMLFYGKYTKYLISEAVVLMLALILLAIQKKWHIFKTKRLNFWQGVALCLPIIILSGFMLFANSVNLIITKLNFANLLSMLLYCAFIGLFEEIFYRGIIQKELVDHYGSNRREVIISIVISGIIFGAVHLTNLFVGQDLLTTIMQLVQTSAIGILLGAVYYLSNNIWSVIFIHGFYDFSVMLSDVNLIKDCGYASVVPWQITMQMMVASFILSTIYILYSLILLKKSKMATVLNIEVSEEEVKRDKLSKKILTIIICVLTGLFFVFNAISNLFIRIDEDSYYICYNYAEKEIKKMETHYYNYDEFSIMIDNTSYRVYVQNNRVVLEQDKTKEKIELDIDNVEKIAVINNKLLILATDYIDYYLYYAPNIVLSDIDASFKKYDVPDISAIGYLKDADTNIVYPMAKSQINDLFIIDDNNIYKAVEKEE